MATLFDEEYGTYNNIARELDIETTKAIRPLFEKYVKAGYKLKEIAYIIISNVGMEECERRLTRNGKIAQAKMKERQHQSRLKKDSK